MSRAACDRVLARQPPALLLIINLLDNCTAVIGAKLTSPTVVVVAAAAAAVLQTQDVFI